jgi:hypothetical protein
VSAMAFACPHCGEPGISATAKLLSAGAMWWGWSATCRFCRQRSHLSGTAINVQFGLLVAAFATVPWLPEGEARIAAGYLAAAAILAVGLLAPMKKDLVS